VGAPSAGSGAPAAPVFRERLTGGFAPDVLTTALPLALLGGFFVGIGWHVAGGLGLALGAFVAFFFRNPARALPGDERTVVAPADGRVVEAGEIELADGRKARRVGIFLSIFDVHVNRAPVAGRVVSMERDGDAYLAAFNPEAPRRNVRLALELETAAGERVGVVQITGLVARRIVCHPEIGEWLPRGARYGLIRFGSRTDVVLPPTAELRVAVGERVRGGSSIVAELPGEGSGSAPELPREGAAADAPARGRP
jgi:phosphatidylserine decarboxylase